MWDYCRSCAQKGKRSGRTGDTSTNWKGGRYIHPRGYVLVWLAPDDFFKPMANQMGRVLEHRLVMAKHLGRCLQPWEVVHHKNGVKDDNRLENLELTASVAEHIAQHSKGYRDGYQQGLEDGRTKQLQELRTLLEEQTKLIRLLIWQTLQISKETTKQGGRL